MSFRVIINGREVTPEENAAHTARMVALHGGVAGMTHAPGIQTNDTFRATMGTIGQMQPTEREAVMRNLKKRGVSASPNGHYCASLADYEGDPGAYLSPSDDRSKLVIRARERGNLDC